MATAVNVNLNRIHVGTWKELLKVAQHADSFLARASVGEQGTSIFFSQGRVASKNIVFLLIARLIAHHPIGHNKIRERIPRTPGVIALVKNRFVEDEVYNGIRNVADLMHGVTLLVG